MLQPAAPTAATSRPRLLLLEADPELGMLLDAESFSRARASLTTTSAPLTTGPWEVGRLRDASPANAGLLILSGVVAREVALAGDVSSELLGAGDLIRPWADGETRLVEADVRWNVLATGRVALLDSSFMARAAAYPGVAAMLMERIEARAHRLATVKAIAQLTRVDERLVAVIRHFCERWGRVTGDGILLPLCLSHRMLGELVGARRPSVSTAAAALERAGRLIRRPDGTWLVRDDETVPRPAPDSVAQRRRLLAV
ncbi:Crp/Fnr family transcriptional regulator [Solirubrobacter sp. CPCC 204708]|uniref:Crp/Fnr family transcriptional regulator n=1 Tax=Solirubrobacter deserti TaxID=2282478 RepID=A0ABT4RCJ0_9ACTN|nr:Crp/Fnr family transcriptional regulator [Solirubrobacter deserti]MBE2315610.1 Crp/Fnr family transcriptional regulator [Solirubrobacter deserti]MDA0136249.1 Crp/Fnr family transcriptional regulator [Solirubrobacter deserti]